MIASHTGNGGGYERLRVSVIMVLERSISYHCGCSALEAGIE
jgi:hypothetical protein